MRLEMKKIFRETVNNNETDKNNDSDYTEATNNDQITPVPPLSNNVFNNDSNVQLSANSHCSCEKNGVEISKLPVNKLIFSNSDMMKK